MRFLMLICSLLLSSCSQAAPEAVSVVSPGVYRGPQPDEAGFAKLKAMGIRTILKLNSEQEPAEKAAAAKFGMRLVEVPMSGILAPSDRQISQALSAVESPVMRPVYIHCEHGKDRTGIVVAFHRVRDERWTPQKAHDEWMAMGHSPLLFLMDHYFWEKTE